MSLIKTKIKQLETHVTADVLTVDWATLDSDFSPPPMTSRRTLGPWQLGPCVEIPNLPSTSSHGLGSRLGGPSKVVWSVAGVRLCCWSVLLISVNFCSFAASFVCIWFHLINSSFPSMYVLHWKSFLFNVEASSESDANSEASSSSVLFMTLLVLLGYSWLSLLHPEPWLGSEK